jgi:hypothetical protein
VLAASSHTERAFTRWRGSRAATALDARRVLVHRTTNQTRVMHRGTASRRRLARTYPAPSPTPFAAKSPALFDVADEVNSAIVPGCLSLHYEYLLLFICL